jgi:tetratricopeptide (TPR) repeat protein
MPDDLPFVGRAGELAAFEALISGEHREPGRRVLVVTGISGIGKSALLRQYAALARAQGLEVGEVDFDFLSAEAGVEEVLVRTITSAIVGHEPAAFRAAVAQAAAKLAGTRPTVTPEAVYIRQTAILGGTIRDVHIDVHDSYRAMVARYQVYRSELVAALIEAVTPVRRVLLIDTAEVLSLLDDRVAESVLSGPPSGLAFWFEAVLLPALLEASPALLLVVAGREPLLQSEWRVGSQQLQLGSLELDDTRRLVLASGLGAGIADDIHRVCLGVPIWTALAIDVCVAGGVIDVRTVADQAVAEWLPRVFLARLSPAAQRVLTAAAVPQVLTEDALAMLLAGDPAQSEDGWYREFCGHSFVSPEAGTTGRRLHPLVRAALLRDLAVSSPARLRDMHAAMAAWIREEVAAHYHRFAACDCSRLEDWVSAVETAFERYDLGRVQLLLSAALTPEHADRLAAECPQAHGVASHWSGRIARMQDRLEDARDDLEAAAKSLADADAEPELSAVLLDMARLAAWTGSSPEAERLAYRALAVSRSAGDPVETGMALLQLARFTSDPEVRREHLTAAAERFEAAPNDHALARALLELGDYDRALQVFKDDGCDRGMAEVLIAFGDRAKESGNAEVAAEHFGHARAHALAAPDPALAGEATRHLGQMAMSAGDCERARRLFQEALGHYEAAHDVPEQARMLRALAEVILRQRGSVEAFDFLMEASRRYRALQDVAGQAAVLAEMGDVLRKMGHFKLADETYALACTGYTQAGDGRQQIRILRRRASIVHEQLESEKLQAERSWLELPEDSRPTLGWPGVDPSQAERAGAAGFLREALDLSYRYMPASTGWIMLDLASVVSEGAQELLSDARQFFTERGIAYGEARALATLARVTGAREQYLEAIALCQSLPGSELLQAQALQGLGDLCVASGAVDEAQTWYGRAFEAFGAYSDELS